MKRRFRLAVVNSHPIQYFAPLYRRLAETDDIDLTVFYCSRQGLDAQAVDPGFGHVVVWDVPLLDGYKSKFLRNWGGERGVRGFFSLFNWSIVREISAGDFDAVLIHGHNSATNLLALAAAKVFRTAVFVRCETHLSLARSTMRRWLRKPLMSFFYRSCDACLFIGTWNRQFYEYHSVPSHKLFPVPYTVDNEFFSLQCEVHSSDKQALRRSLGIRESALVILYASKLIDRKRPADLLQAYARLLEQGVDAELLFVGEGAQRKELEALATSRGISGVHFAGFQNQRELPRYYAIADVFVLPSEYEPWGLIINELMCAGVPIVTTTDVGAAPDLVIVGKTGFVYPTGDIGALAAALAAILTNPELAKQLGEQARTRISQWSYEQCIEGVRAALESKCSRSRASRSPQETTEH